MSPAVASEQRAEDIFVPRHEIHLDGEDVSARIATSLISLRYRDSLDAVGSLELKLNDWDSVRHCFRFSETDDFLPGTGLRLSLGYRGQASMDPVLDGTIQWMNLELDPDRPMSVTIGAIDRLHELRGEQQTIVYEDVTDSEIAEQIASRLGLPIRTSSKKSNEPRYAYVCQANEYDLLFLRERARRVGYWLRLEPKGSKFGLYFGPSDTSASKSLSLSWGKTLHSFAGRISTAAQVEKVKVRAWDPIAKENIEASASWGDLAIQGVPSDQGRLSKAWKGRTENIVTEPVDSEAEGKVIATARMDRIAKRLLVARGRASGLPELRVGAQLEIHEVGDRFSGNYFVTSCEHVIDGHGYRTEFECQREEY